MAWLVLVKYDCSARKALRHYAIIAPKVFQKVPARSATLLSFLQQHEHQRRYNLGIAPTKRALNLLVVVLCLL